MIFFPYGTDAPIYHWPITTGAIIVTNVVLFSVTTLQAMLGNIEFESIEWLILEFDTINPLQWITGSFMHLGPMHLIGNMMFLWAFGLVVEGKIGNIPFLILYLTLCLLDGLMVQVPMFIIYPESGAAGASGVIFALMMIAMIWAPENEMDFWWWAGFIFYGTAEIRIVSVAALFVVMQVLFLFIGGFEMSSEMLHMIGAAIGAPIGFIMLNRGMVDCEGWDIISRNAFLRDPPFLCTPERREELSRAPEPEVDPIAAALAAGGSNASPDSLNLSTPRRRTNTPTTSSPESATPARRNPLTGRRAKPKIDPAEEQERLRQEAIAKATRHPEFNRLNFVLRQSVQEKNLPMAQQNFLRLDQLKLTPGVSEKSLFQYVSLLAAHKQAVDTLRPLQLIVSREGELADQARLRMALVQLKVLQKPQLAIQTLNEIIDGPNQKPEIIAKRDQLLRQAGG